MSYTAHPTVVTGQLWSATDQNTYVKGNFDAVWVYTAKGDLAVAVSSSALAAVAAGGDFTLPMYDSAESSGVRPGHPPIPLKISSAITPLSGDTPAEIVQEESSASAPKENQFRAYFDQNDVLEFQFSLPCGMGNAPLLRLYFYMASATSGNMTANIYIAAISEGDSGVTSKAYDTANSGSQTVPGSAGTLEVMEVTLADRDDWEGLDLVSIRIKRTDALSGKMIMLDSYIHYQDGT